MVDFLKFLIAKAIRRSNLAALRNCCVDHTAVVLGGCQLTKVSIGQYTYCGYHCTITDTEIGAFCSIADRVVIGGGSHPVQYVSTSPVFYSGRNILQKNFSTHDHRRAPNTKIGNDVWVGHGALIKAGVEVGDGAVIGMGSVVTKNVPAYSIWAGNPARLIRDRFDTDTVQRLLDIEWWNWDDTKLEKYASCFNNPQKFTELDGDL